MCQSMSELYKVVEEYVNWLSSIGLDSKGGTTRLLYDAAWLEAQNGLKEKFVLWRWRKKLQKTQ